MEPQNFGMLKPPEVIFEAGVLKKVWRSPELEFPIAPTSLMVEKDLTKSVGGWQGLVQAEDFGMVIAVTNKASGFAV